MASQWLQQHGWLGLATAGGLALVGYVLSQAQNIESARRLLGLERKKEEPSSSNATHGSNSPSIKGGTFQAGRDQFIGGEHNHTHLPTAPEPKLPETYTPDNLPDRTTSAERFVGRAAALQRLAELLAPEGSRVYLTGMGGVGKSELALQYAYDTRDCFRGGIVRLDARQGLAAMASQLVTFFRGNFPKVALPDDRSPIELLPLCWSQWPAGASPPEPVLLILDDQRGENLPEEQGDTLGYAAERHLFAGLPPRFRRLISQREPAPTGAKAINLPLLERDDSLKLLALQAGESGSARRQAEPQAADAICAEVGDLPLALVLLGARLSERSEMRLSQLLADLRAKGAEAKALQEAHPELGAQRGVVEALLISWEPLSEEARRLGILLGVMAPAEIPWELVEACRLPDQAVEEGSAFGQQQVALRRAQMLERLGDGLYKLHPLVRQFIRLQSRMQEDVAARWRSQLAAAVVQVCRKRIWSYLTPAELHVLGPMVPHIRIVAEQYAAQLKGEDLLWPFVGLARLAEQQRRYAEAMGWYQFGLNECEERLGPTHASTAAALSNLGEQLRVTNRLAEAEPLLLKAMEINTAIYGADHPEVAQVLNNLGLLLQATNRLIQSEKLFREALAIDEASYGSDHPEVAADLNNLAHLLQATNRLAEAEPLMRRALAIDEACFGPVHPKVAIVLNNLAHLLQDTNRLAEAEPLMRRALAIDEACFGPMHPNLAIRLNNLVSLLVFTYRLAEAEPLMRRNAEIHLAFSQEGFDHIEPEACLQNYLALLKVLGLSEFEIQAKMQSLTYQDDFTIATAAKARLLSRNAYLAYRREGGENLLPSGRIVLKIHQALASRYPIEGKSLSNDVHLTFGRYVAVAAIERLIADPEWTSHHVFLAILKDIASGSCDRSLADNPVLTHEESAEVILLIELLEAMVEE